MRFERTEENEKRVVEAYKRLKTYKAVAREIGCSWNTVQRIMVKHGANLGQGNHTPGNGGGGDKPKITDAELIEASKTMNCREIAQFYDMSEERVFRRARRLGLSIKSVGAGGHWKCRADRYGCGTFDESINLKALFNRDGGICQLCGQPTDWNDIKCGHIGRLYPTLDHIIPLSKGGAHTWDNVQLAHMACNPGKCDK